MRLRSVTTSNMARQDVLMNDVWYHGNISRETAEQVLREADETDCFLVRDSSSRSDSYVLSLKYRGEIRHFLACKLLSGLYGIEGTQKALTTFAGVIDYFKEHPLSPRGETLGVALPWWQNENDVTMADVPFYHGYGQEDSLVSQMAAVSIDNPQSSTAAVDLTMLSLLTHGSVVVLDSRSSGKSLRIVNGEVEGRGYRDSQAQFTVHVRRPGVIALQNVHSPENWVAIYDGETKGCGTGGPYSEIVVKTLEGKVVALESVIYAGQHIGILPDGSVKPPNESGADREGQFLPLVISSGLDTPVPEKQLLQHSCIPNESPPSYDSLSPSQSTPQSSHLPVSYPALPIANHQSMAGYLHQQPSVPSSYSSQATPPAASYPSGYPVNPRHSYSGPPIMLPHPQLQSQRQMSSGPSVMLPHPQLQSQRQMSSGPSIMLPHPQFQSQGQMSPQVIAPSGPSSPIGYNIMYIFQNNNIVRLIPRNDPDRFPIKVVFPTLQAKGSYFLADSEFQVINPSPGTVILRSVHWAACHITINKKGRIKADGKNPSDPACHFRIHPQSGNSVCFESLGYPGYYLSMSRSGYAEPANEDAHFFVRVERMMNPTPTTIMTPFGRPSVVNRLHDRCLIQVYSKALNKYLCINKKGEVDGTADPKDRRTNFIYIDRGMGVMSLYSHVNGAHRVRIHQYALQGKGEQNMNSDFFLKENPDSTVCFESVTSPRALVTIGEGLNVQINFNLFLLNVTKTKKSEAVTRFQLN